MSLFASTGFGTSNVFGAAAGTQQNTTTAAPNSNPMKDIEVSSPPDDTVSQLAFSPVTTNNAVLLAASSWDNSIRVWEVQGNGQSVPKAMQTHAAPVLDVCWNDEGTQLFTASCDNTGKIWDLASNQTMQFAQHAAPIRSVHYVKSPSYTCILTTSWDKTMRLWDTRQPGQCVSVDLPERSYASAVRWPVGVVTTANRHLIVYNLENPTKEFRTVESPLKYQHRCVAVFVDHKKSPPSPAGFAVGSIEGRVAIQYLNPPTPKDNFTFKCHRSEVGGDGCQDIYAVNKCVFHPTNGKLATVGSDGRFSFWDIYARTKLKTSEQFEAPLTTGCFDAQGNVFAYAVGYDWSKGHEHFDPARKPRIFMRLCEADFRSQPK